MSSLFKRLNPFWQLILSQPLPVAQQLTLVQRSPFDYH